MTDKERVLVVDDDPAMLRGVARVLRQHGYEPVLFASAEAFKTHNDFEEAACIILDINLNDGSGIELGRGSTAAAIYVPVIYITANENPAVRAAALQSGCLAYLTKPFSANSLVEPLKAASAGAHLDTLRLCLRAHHDCRSNAATVAVDASLLRSLLHSAERFQTHSLLNLFQSAANHRRDPR